MLARWTMANRLKWYAKLFSHLMLCRVLYLSFFQCEDDFAPAHSQKNWPSQQVSQPSCIQSFLQGSAAVHLTCKHIHTHAHRDTHTYWRWQGCLSSGQEESVMCCGLLSRREDPDAERRRLLLWHTKGREVINDRYRSGRKLPSLFSPTQVGSWSKFLSTWPRNNWVTVVAQQPQQPLQMYWGQSVQTGSKY